MTGHTADPAFITESAHGGTFGSVPAETAAHRIAALLLLAAGAALRIWQYAGATSLWIDEAALARNVVDRSWSALLFEPLAYGQVAPPGFLLVQKVLVSIGGRSELVLRGFPLVCGLAALLVFRRVASRLLPPSAAVFALALFALGQPFIYFSAQAKQYAPDAMASLIAVLVVHAMRDARMWTRAATVGLVAGLLLPWLSPPASLVLVGGALTAATATALRVPTLHPRPLFVALVAWLASAGAAGLFSSLMVASETRRYMEWFWRNGFIPPAPGRLLGWAWMTLTDMFSAFGANALRTNGGLGYAWPELFVVFTLLGFVVLSWTRRDDALLLAGAIAAALAASLLRLYPLSGRLTLFVTPILLLAAAAGAHAIWAWTRERSRVAGAAVALLVVAIPVWTAVRARPPYSVQPVRSVLEEVRAVWQEGDVAYVDYAAGQAFLYYAPGLGFAPNDYVVGRCAGADRRAYLRQVDAFRGRSRMWIIATHLSITERPLTVGYLERIGRRLASIFEPPVNAPLQLAAYARLYDLSDPARLAATDAERHPVPQVPFDGDLETWGCAGPMNPFR